MRTVRMVVLALGILLLCSTMAFATEIDMGLKFATAFTGIRGEFMPGYGFSSDERLGFTAGPYIRFSTDDRILSFQPELHLSYLNTKLSMGYPPYSHNLRIWYVELPLMMRGAFPLPTQSYVAPFLIVGPKVGIRLSDNADELGVDLDTLAFAIEFGAGIDFGENSVEVRYARDVNAMAGDVKKHVIRLFYSRNIR